MLHRNNDDKPILITDSTSYSVSMLDDMSGKIACYLTEQNLCMGDHVAVLTNDQASLLAITSACYKSGFVLVCLDPSLGTEQITSTFDAVRPKAVFADLSVLENLNNAPTSMPSVVLDTSSRTTPRRWLPGQSLPWKTVDAILRSALADTSYLQHPTKQIDPKQTAYIMFTSGSTDKPKGVVISRAALQQHVDTLCNVFNYGSKARLLCFLPAYHTDGLVHCCYVPLIKGMCVIRPGAFKVSTDFEHYSRSHGATHFLAVPTILSMLQEFYSDKTDLFTEQDLLTVISTAGTLEKSVVEKFSHTFGIKLHNFYGLTETVSGALYCDTATQPIDSLGKPVGVEARLVNQSGIITETHTTGELQLRSKQLMTGYFENPMLSTQAMDQGWFKTGDLFTIDDQGHYFFKGRLKDIIKKGGTSIYPQEIRNQLLNHPKVNECEVIGKPDPVFEEVVVACIVSDTPVLNSELAEFCNASLAQEMRPDHFVTLNYLPRTAVGKINRSVLLALVEKQLACSPTADSTVTDTIEKGVIDLAAKVFKYDCDKLRTSMSKDQISGWDSYAHLKFIKQIEKTYDVRLKARDIMKIETLEDAITFIKEKTSSSEAA